MTTRRTKNVPSLTKKAFREHLAGVGCDPLDTPVSEDVLTTGELIVMRVDYVRRLELEVEFLLVVEMKSKLFYKRELKAARVLLGQHISNLYILSRTITYRSFEFQFGVAGLRELRARRELWDRLEADRREELINIMVGWPWGGFAEYSASLCELRTKLAEYGYRKRGRRLPWLLYAATGRELAAIERANAKLGKLAET